MLTSLRRWSLAYALAVTAAAVGYQFVLAHLREETGESAQVGMLDGHDVVYVDRLESSHALRLFTETGRRVPVHCTSSGKVLLAFAPEPVRERFLATAALQRHTPHTITDPDGIMLELPA